MTDSSSFTSLMALVDSHLSKTSMQASKSEDADNRFPRFQLPSLTGGPNETLSETRLSLAPGQRLPLPTLSLTESPIQEVLAKQVSNMLKAKEKKKQQDEEVARLAKEREVLAEEMRKLKMDDNRDDNDDCVIDLVKAVQESMHFKRPDPPPKEETLSSSSSFETLFEPKFIDCDTELERVKTPEPLLPCKTDMSYILKQKVRTGKCSAFGKVLTSRLRPVAAPYLRNKVHSKVVRFDFSTKSPCDLIKEKLRQPRPYPSRTFDLFSIFPDLETEFSK
ncbi:hypothetical protein ABMA28_000064 [Loxostege sticticalis]|uniref:Uncharacterized protein n=1 Tax=Loxostege sticticalis TaxID=481309 RepID=A0ABD0TR80_LOXSC